MKRQEEEKKALDWEMKDPKPPVVQSGYLEDRRK